MNQFMKIFFPMVMLILRFTVLQKCTNILLSIFFRNSNLFLALKVLVTTSQLNVFLKFYHNTSRWITAPNVASHLLNKFIRQVQITRFLFLLMSQFFTNIPLKVTIELAVTVLLEKEPSFRISKNDLNNLFEIAIYETHFVFKKVYDQIYRVAMGLTLGSV